MSFARRTSGEAKEALGEYNNEDDNLQEIISSGINRRIRQLE